MIKPEIVNIQLLRAVKVATKNGAGPLFTIVHGACPTGADKFASDWVKEIGPQLLSSGGITVCEEPHPLDESKGAAAESIRNYGMARHGGADLMLAFPKGKDKATRHCIRWAKAAGVSVLSRECGPDE